MSRRFAARAAPHACRNRPDRLATGLATTEGILHRECLWSLNPASPARRDRSVCCQPKAGTTPSPPTASFTWEPDTRPLPLALPCRCLSSPSQPEATRPSAPLNVANQYALVPRFLKSPYPRGATISRGPRPALRLVQELVSLVTQNWRASASEQENLRHHTKRWDLRVVMPSALEPGTGSTMKRMSRTERLPPRRRPGNCRGQADLQRESRRPDESVSATRTFSEHQRRRPTRLLKARLLPATRHQRRMAAWRAPGEIERFRSECLAARSPESIRDRRPCVVPCGCEG